MFFTILWIDCKNLTCVWLESKPLQGVEQPNAVFLLSAPGQYQSPHIAVCDSQSALQQVQEPTGQHHALWNHPGLPAANQRPGGLRLHQRQLHWRIQVCIHHRRREIHWCDPTALFPRDALTAERNGWLFTTPLSPVTSCHIRLYCIHVPAICLRARHSLLPWQNAGRWNAPDDSDVQIGRTHMFWLFVFLPGAWPPFSACRLTEEGTSRRWLHNAVCVCACVHAGNRGVTSPPKVHWLRLQRTSGGCCGNTTLLSWSCSPNWGRWDGWGIQEQTHQRCNDIKISCFTKSTVQHLFLWCFIFLKTEIGCIKQLYETNCLRWLIDFDWIVNWSLSGSLYNVHRLFSFLVSWSSSMTKTAEVKVQRIAGLLMLMVT